VRSKTTTSTIILAVLVIAIAACEFDNSLRVLRSVNITLPVADARSFAKGKCSSQESLFQQPPSPAPVLLVWPYLGQWSTSDPSIATVDQSGVAHCIGDNTRNIKVHRDLIHEFDSWSCNVCQRDRSGAINRPFDVSKLWSSRKPAE